MTVENNQSDVDFIEATEKNNLLFEMVSDGILILENGIFIDSNNRTSEILGFTKEEIIGKKISDIFFDENVEEKHFKTNYSYSIIKIFVKCKNENIIFIEIRIKTLSNGKIIALLKKIPTVTENENKYNELLNILHEGVWVVDENGYTTLVNPRMCEMLGYESVNDIIGHHLFEFMDEEAKNISIKYIENGKNIIRDSQDFIFTKKGGSKLYAMLETSPVFDETQKYKGLMAAVSDITDVINNEKILKKAREEAERALNIRNNFIATIGHQIRTPMNSILGFSDLILNETENITHKEYLESIKSNGQNLLNLINDILELSKAESGNIEVKEEITDFNDISEEIKKTFSSSLFQKNLDFSIKMLPDNFPYLVIDKIHLLQIFKHLIKNAIDFTEKGSISLLVELGKFYSGSFEQISDITITVKDTGKGISPDEQKNIFEPFKQIGNMNAKKHYGTGLGLNISKHLVEKMNGYLSFESELGKGSSFIIYIPSVKVIQKKSGEDITSEKYTYKSSFVILLVDDSEMNRKLLKNCLKKHNVKIIEAENGQQGVDFALQYKPDLVLMDLKMPVISGYEANQMLKTNPELSKIPVIAITAYSYDDFDYKKALFEDYIEKPINKEILINMVEKYMKIDNTFEKEEKIFNPIVNNLFSKNTENYFYVISLLENYYGLKWKSVCETNSFDIIGDFACEIIKLGKDYSIEVVENYGVNLLKYNDSFDIEGLQKLLGSYSELIRNLKSNI